MSDKEMYIDLCNYEPQIPLFLRPEWLDAILIGQHWDVSLVKEDDKVIAALPYQIKKKWGITAYTSPWMTPPTDPWIRNLPTTANGKSVSRYHKIVSMLLEPIDKAQYKNFRIDPKTYTGHAWFWKGFELFTQYTYRLALNESQLIFDAMKNTLRTDIRNSDSLCISKIDDPNEFFEYLQIQVGYNYDLLTQGMVQKIFDLKDYVIPLKATNKDEVIGCSLFIRNQNRLFYLIGARMKPGSNLAMTAMLWHIIKTYSGQNLTLDFEGSMIKGVEKYFRGFGGLAYSTLNPIKMPSWMKLIM